jgi:hypothetical protein
VTSALRALVHVASYPLMLALYLTVLCERVLMLCAWGLALWDRRLSIKRSGGGGRAGDSVVDEFGWPGEAGGNIFARAGISRQTFQEMFIDDEPDAHGRWDRGAEVAARRIGAAGADGGAGLSWRGARADLRAVGYTWQRSSEGPRGFV